METLLRDVRFAFRTLLRNRGFALAALVTLALGIGASTAVFSVVNAVLIRPLPYADPDEVMIVWLRNVPESIEEDVTSFPNFSDWQARNTSFEHLAAASATNVNLTTGGEPEQLRAARVSAGFFDVAGVGAVLGRTLFESESEPGAEGVVVLSHGVWARRFGGDPQIIDRTVSLNGSPYTIVGVMPPAFDLPHDVDLWIPLAPVGSLEPLMQARGALWLQVFGRLRDGVPVERAQMDMNAVAGSLAEQYPQQAGWGVNLEPLREELVGDVRPGLLVLLGAVGFVLLIACANVANLLLARGAVRGREISVRLAIGAERSRVVRQLLTESVLLGLAGGALGLVCALWTTRLVATHAPTGLEWLTSASVDPTVVAFAVLISLATGILFGVAPALQASGAQLSDALREGGRGGTGAVLDRLGPVLVATQVGLALVLLVGAGLLMRSFVALQDVPLGFESESRLTFRISLPAARYPDGADAQRFFNAALDDIRALPGVESAAAVSNLLLPRLPGMAAITVAGQAPAGPDDPRISVVNDAVLGNFFETMNIELVRGRRFNATDGEEAPSAVIVNETFVRTFLSDGRDPIGRRFVFGQPGDDATWNTIVGVVRDTKRSGAAQDIRPEAFFVHAQNPRGSMQFVIATNGDPLALVAAVRNVIGNLDRDLPVAQLETVTGLLGEEVAMRRFIMQLLALFSLLAATLAAIGIYGVMAYLVTQRTRELGIRMAVGAHRGAVLLLVLGDAARQIVPGLILGTAAALALSRLLRSQLFGVGPNDPATFVAVALLFTAVALLASALPAWRATQTDPMAAFRAD
ncbi:MAG: ABC transporter permease [Longimicrobiales bacterium]